MGYVYAVELYKQCKEETSKLFERHYSEVAPDASDGLLDPDYAQYEWLCKNGMLHIVTVRLDGVLIGYHVSFVKPQIHRRTTLTAHSDIFYIVPEHRKGMVGYKLFAYVEETLRRKGVKWIYTGVKLAKDVGRILERQGHHENERQFLKILK